jgi:cleavage stimulation factor subunit 3
VAFETAVTRLVKKPELVEKSKPLYAYFHKYESQYGELSQIRKLEQRMAELFPNDPKLQLFATRYSTDGFEPTKIQPIISPNTQMRPRGSTVLPSIEQHTVQPSVANSPRPHFVQENSPRPQYVPTTNSPKRPFQMDDNDELNRPRKLARGESPLKGAAGRRLNQQKQLQQNQGVPQWHSNAPPFVVPRDITFLLSIIPRGDLYTSTKFNGDAMVRLLGKTHIPDFGAWKSTQSQPQPPVQQQVPQYGRPSAVSNDRPQSRDPTSYNFAPPQDDRRNASSWSSQAPSYGGGPSPVTHERDGFSRPPSYAQGLHPQGLPPRPDANNALTGYYQQDYNGPPGGAVNGAGWQQQPPQPQYSNQGPSLMPAQTWYPNPTDQYPPGQAGYPYNR